MCDLVLLCVIERHNKFSVTFLDLEKDTNSNVPIEEPVKDKVIGLRWLKLRSHVASAVHCTECQASIVRLPVASDLALYHVLLPFTGLVPAQSGDPGLGADCGHRTVSISRIVQHLDFASELLVDPLTGFRFREVGDLFSAEVPGLHEVRHMHGGSHCITVHVVKETGSEGAWGKQVLR